jgi:hypothetical protein
LVITQYVTGYLQTPYLKEKHKIFIINSLNLCFMVFKHYPIGKGPSSLKKQ